MAIGVLTSIRIPINHREKLDDVARHDTEKYGRLVTRSTLIRSAIKKFLLGRKDALYGSKKKEINSNDTKPE